MLYPHFGTIFRYTEYLKKTGGDMGEMSKNEEEKSP